MPFTQELHLSEAKAYHIDVCLRADQCLYCSQHQLQIQGQSLVGTEQKSLVKLQAICGHLGLRRLLLQPDILVDLWRVNVHDGKGFCHQCLGVIAWIGGSDQTCRQLTCGCCSRSDGKQRLLQRFAMAIHTLQDCRKRQTGFVSLHLT